MLFNIFINDLVDGAECILSKFTDHPKLDTSEGHAAIQMDLNSLENWTEWNLMKLSKRKYTGLHLGRNTPGTRDCGDQTAGKQRSTFVS